MKKYLKIGQFAFLLPYFIMPLIIMADGEPFINAIVFSLFLFFGIEHPVVLIYPICWIISVYCFIRCVKDSKKESDQTEQAKSKGCLTLFIVIVILNIITVAAFIANFEIAF